MDWLRVLAILVVFSAHAAMPFQTEPGVWLVQEAQTSLVFTLYVAFWYQWIMQLFFFLAGAGASFALARHGSAHYLSGRLQRLLVPLLIGTLTLVPFQEYLALRTMGEVEGGFFQFYPGWFGYCAANFSPLALLYNCYVRHLWFLGFLFAYALLTLPLLLELLKPAGRRFTHWLAGITRSPYGLLWYVIPIALIQATLRARFPQHQGFSDFLQWLVYFVYGFIFMQDPRFMEAVQDRRRTALAVGGVSFAAILLLLGPAGFADVWERSPSFSPGYALYQVLRSLNSWAWVLFALGMGRKALNFSNRFLRYASEAVLPFYILHHVVIIALALALVAWQPPIFLKFLAAGSAALLVTVLLYEFLVRRFAPLRWMFGLRPRVSDLPGSRGS